jgi:hypothetical protein
MMVMMGVGARMILIRMSPLTMTRELRMRMAAMWGGLVDNVARRVGLDYIRPGDWNRPGWTAESSLVFALLVARIVVLSIVRNGKVTVMSGEGTGRCQRGTVSAEGKSH